MDDFVKMLLDTDVIVTRAGDALEVKREGGPIPPRLVAQMRERKPELMATDIQPWRRIASCVIIGRLFSPTGAKS